MVTLEILIGLDIAVACHTTQNECIKGLKRQEGIYSGRRLIPKMQQKNGIEEKAVITSCKAELLFWNG